MPMAAAMQITMGINTQRGRLKATASRPMRNRATPMPKRRTTKNALPSGAIRICGGLVLSNVRRFNDWTWGVQT